MSYFTFKKCGFPNITLILLFIFINCKYVKLKPTRKSTLFVAMPTIFLLLLRLYLIEQIVMISYVTGYGKSFFSTSTILRVILKFILTLSEGKWIWNSGRMNNSDGFLQPAYTASRLSAGRSNALQTNNVPLVRLTR